MKKSIFNKAVPKQALMGVAVGIGFAASAATPALAGCGGYYNPCRAKKTYSRTNPCAAKHNPCASRYNPCKAHNPCAAKYNPCAAKNPCAAWNPCAAKKKLSNTHQDSILQTGRYDHRRGW